MKQKIALWLLAFAFLPLTAIAQTVSMEINKGWRFKQERLTNWYPATVPGVVHTDLLANHIIDNPFYRLNERGVQWIDKEDWVYQTTFDLSPALAGKKNLRIRFKGLDTYADVYLNGQKIISADNMFRQWTAGIRPLVKPAGNVLKVYFHSPIKTDIPKWDALPFPYMASNDQSENGGVFDKKLSVVARKAGYHYGWDWGPRLVTSGIWRPVVIEGWDDLRIEDLQIVQSNVSARSARIKTVVEVLSDKDVNDASVSVTDGATRQHYGTTTTSLHKGLNKVTVDFTIQHLRLWWSNGLGKPNLYTLKTSLMQGGKEIDSLSQRVGVRSLLFVNKKDKYGKCYYFELNGVPVFAKGANYIPCDNFLPRVTHAIYEKTVRDAVDANMNMLRVWGGGIYEDDYFYDLCDKYGILVFQDFMFACSIYPAEGALLENIRQEAIDNVRRLRNHPCIAIWCGNNECQEAWFGWGWKRAYEKKNSRYADIIWKQYENQYYKVLPEVVAEYGSGTAYIPSSPFSDYGKLSNDHEGDRHYWEVWHGRKPIEEYNKARSRFFTEYGFQSFPEFESVKRYAPDTCDWHITSEVMMSHQRGGEHANQLIEDYLLNEYYKPKDFRSFLYINQLLQGDAIRTAMEAHRRAMGYCMGSLFWQHNDCWPVASWSSRDYYGRWKAQHYFARKAYRDILVSPIEEEGKMHVYVVSDRLKALKGTLTVEVIRLKGGVARSVTRTVSLKADASNMVFNQNINELLKGARRADVVVHASLKVGNDSYSNNYFLLKQKDIDYPKPHITCQAKPVAGGYELTLKSDKFARGVFLSIEGIDNFFSDNYFDILPGGQQTIRLTCSLSQPELEKQLKIVSLADMK